LRRFLDLEQSEPIRAPELQSKRLRQPLVPTLVPPPHEHHASGEIDYPIGDPETLAPNLGRRFVTVPQDAFGKRMTKDDFHVGHIRRGSSSFTSSSRYNHSDSNGITRPAAA
jgi:hypothetical protein